MVWVDGPAPQTAGKGCGKAMADQVHLLISKQLPLLLLSYRHGSSFLIFRM